MFQFRRFPTYCYLIHSTLIRYCRTGFPHSDISGSMLICSSPKLFAACRVLHRLLMPRHSPCALFSLTYVRVSSLRSVSRLRGKLHIRFLPLPSQIETRFNLLGTRKALPLSLKLVWSLIIAVLELCRLNRSYFFTQNCIYPRFYS